MAARSSRKIPWIALTTILIGLTATFFAGRYAEKQEAQLLQNQSDSVSNLLLSETNLHLHYREQSLERMALRLQRKKFVPKSEWTRDAKAYIKRQPGYLGLLVLRFDLNERWAVPETTPEDKHEIATAFPHKLLSNEPELKHAAKAHTKATRIFSDGKRVLPIAYPLFSAGKLFGYLVAFVEIESFFDSFLNEFSGLLPAIAVEEQNKVIYQRGELQPGPSSTRQLTSSFANSDLTWTITAQANSLYSSSSIKGKSLVFSLGSVISLALGMIVFALQQNMLNLKKKLAAENTAIESNKFLNLIMRHTPDLIFVKDEEFRLVLANPAFLALYPEDQRDNIIGSTTVEKYDAKEAEEFLRHDRVAFLNGHSETEETIHFPDGSIQTLLTTKIRFHDHNGDPYILGVARKITELKKTLAELARSNSELDDFAHIASHDLKAPLRGIHNHVRFLREDYEALFDESGLHRLERLSYLTKRMEKLIVDLLSYSSLGRGEESTGDIDLKLLIHDIANNYEPNEFELELVGNFPILKCNEIRMTKLFTNLIGNAIKYNDSEKKQITIRCEYSNVIEGNGLLFSISDNGLGIDQRFHEDIFVLFKRLHSQDEYGGGTGSGLTFVSKIVSLYDGDIWLTSEPGAGSTFFFTLPGAHLSNADETNR